MKKIYVIGITVLTLGLALLIIGKVNHGEQEADLANSGKRSSMIERASNFFTNSEQSAHKVKTVTKITQVKPFSSIKLNVDQPDVQIAHGEKFQVTVIGHNPKKVGLAVTDHQLIITDNGSYDDGYRIAITVPKNKDLENIDGSCSEGDFSLRDLTIGKVDLQLQDGDVTVNNVKTKNANFYLDDGDLMLTDSSLSQSILNLNSGDLTVTNCHLKTTASLDDGDVSINNSKIIDDCLFNLNDGDFQASQISKTSCRLSIASYDDDDDENINYHGHSYRKYFSEIIKGTPLLKVVCSDGEIKIN